MSNDAPLSAHQQHAAWLREFARDGLLGLAVPTDRGGRGGTLADIRHTLQALIGAGPDGPARATVWAAQRLLIDVLLHADNRGIVDYRLPALLEGDIAGSCVGAWQQLAGQPVVAVQARDTGRHWRLDGSLPATPNLPGWFLASAPVVFEGRDGHALVLLKSEEDGLSWAPPAGDDPLARTTATAALSLRDVFFWEDEILSNDGEGLLARVAPLTQLLRPVLQNGQKLQPLAAG